MKNSGKAKKIFLWSGIIIFICAAVFFILDKKRMEIFNQVCFNGQCLEVEVASTPKDRERGLMFRENLERNKGMLFIFENEGIYGFWIQNTLIPLDIIWINEDKEVVFIKNNALPCTENLCPSI